MQQQLILQHPRRNLVASILRRLHYCYRLSYGQLRSTMSPYVSESRRVTVSFEVYK